MTEGKVMIYLWHTTETTYPHGEKKATFRNYTDVSKYLEADKKMWARICREFLDEQWELITPDGPLLINSWDGRQEYYRRLKEEENATGV
jgi:hypothetical protein